MSPRFPLTIFPFLLAPLLIQANSDSELWKEIMSPASVPIPSPVQDSVLWRDDFGSALEEAARTGLPLLVTWRCLPCKQCAEFDQDVMEGSALLTPLLRQFITVRMTDAAKLDERYFPYRGYQDLDLSWWGYFLSPQGELYGVFGGKDHISDTTRISEAAFANTMKRVLAHHYDPRRPSWKVDGPLPQASAPARRPSELAGADRYRESRPYLQNQTCLHCHQVHDLVHQEAMTMGTFDLKQYTQAWPFPENVGLVVDRDDGLRVTRVLPGSPADQAGLEVGDQLAMADRQRLFGQADFRGVLHRAPYGDARILLGWIRESQPHLANLQLQDGWRESESAWRKSVYEGIVGPHLGFFPLRGPNQGKGSMSFKPFLGKGAKAREKDWWKAGLRPQMEILSVNGRDDDWNSRQLIAWFRLHHQGGDPVALRVRDGKQVKTIHGKAAQPH